jgi:hypothetical protein
MKVNQEQETFPPVVITLESLQEVRDLLRVLMDGLPTDRIPLESDKYSHQLAEYLYSIVAFYPAKK